MLCIIWRCLFELSKLWKQTYNSIHNKETFAWRAFVSREFVKFVWIAPASLQIYIFGKFYFSEGTGEKNTCFMLWNSVYFLTAEIWNFLVKLWVIDRFDLSNLQTLVVRKLVIFVNIVETLYKWIHNRKTLVEWLMDFVNLWSLIDLEKLLKQVYNSIYNKKALGSTTLDSLLQNYIWYIIAVSVNLIPMLV